MTCCIFVLFRNKRSNFGSHHSQSFNISWAKFGRISPKFGRILQFLLEEKKSRSQSFKKPVIFFNNEPIFYEDKSKLKE